MENKEFWRIKMKEDGSIEKEYFEPYDFQSAAGELDLENKASQFALTDPPETMDHMLTDHEKSFIGHVNDHIYKLNDWFSLGAGNIRNLITKKSDAADPDRNFIKIREGFDKNVVQSEIDFKHNHDNVFGQLRKKELYLNKFRNDNDLFYREAKVPDSIRFQIALIAAAIFLEACMNMIFFAPGSEMGYLGGWLEALVVSIVNVAVSIIAGLLFLREAFHVKPKRRVFGWAGFIISLAVLALVHLAAAHYRELIIKNSDAEFAAALTQLWNNPFGLQNFFSLLLMILGWCISIAVILEAHFKLADKYPGYGTMWSDWQSKTMELAELRKTFKEQVNSAYNIAISETHSFIEKINEGKQELEMLRGDIESFFEGCEASYEQAKNGVSNLIKEYRNDVRSILGNSNRFLFDERLLVGQDGIKSLGIAFKKQEIVDYLDKSIEKLNIFSNGYPEKQRVFKEDLDELRNDKASEAALEKILKQAEEKEQYKEQKYKKILIKNNLNSQ